LLSIVVTELVSRLSPPSNGDLFEDFFFKNKAYTFTGVGENALSGGVKVWLDRFHLSTENYKPVITVSELGNEQFDVQVSIEDESDAENLPVPVTKILQDKQYRKATVQDTAVTFPAVTVYKRTRHTYQLGRQSTHNI